MDALTPAPHETQKPLTPAFVESMVEYGKGLDGASAAGREEGPSPSAQDAKTRLEDAAGRVVAFWKAGAYRDAGLNSLDAIYELSLALSKAEK